MIELKAIVVFLIIILILYTAITYEKVDSKTFGMGSPSLKSVVLFIITVLLFIYGLYLNENPILLNI